MIATQDDAEAERLREGLHGAVPGLEDSFVRKESIDPREVIFPPPLQVPMYRVWIDASSTTDSIMIYIADAEWERILVRRFPKRADESGAEITRESVFNAVGTALDALTQGGKIGTSRDDVGAELGVLSRNERPKNLPPWEAPAPARLTFMDETAPPPHSAFHYDLAAGYSTTALSSTVWSHGPFVMLGAHWQTKKLRFGVAFEGQFRIPFLVERSPFSLDIQGGAARLVLFAEYQPWSFFALRGILGAGMEIFRTAIFVNDPTRLWSIQPPSTESVFLGRAAVETRWKLNPNAPTLALGLSLDVDPSGLRFLVVRDGTRSVLLDPWPVRPGLFVAVETP